MPACAGPRCRSPRGAAVRAAGRRAHRSGAARSRSATRQQAVELLGRWLAQDAKLRGVLEKIVANDGRPEIREAAKQALQKLQKV